FRADPLGLNTYGRRSPRSTVRKRGGEEAREPDERDYLSGRCNWQWNAADEGQVVPPADQVVENRHVAPGTRKPKSEEDAQERGDWEPLASRRPTGELGNRQEKKHQPVVGSAPEHKGYD